MLGVLITAAVASPDVASADVASVPCSVGALIAAINAANQAGSGVLNLAAHCTYTLTAPDNETDGANGLPVLTGRITINGKAGTTIARNTGFETPDFRIIEVAPHGTAAITNLTLTGGKPSDAAFQGGAIDNEGSVTSLSHDVIHANSAGIGGGIYNNGRITDLNHDRISGNAAFNGGALFNGDAITAFTNDVVAGNDAGIGAGISNGGSIVNLSHCTITDNRLTGNGAGGGIANFPGSLNMSHDVVTDNTATAGPQASGGGIDNLGKLTITDSVVKGNVAAGFGGGIRNEEAPKDPHFVVIVRSTEILDNRVASASGPVVGGGISNSGVMSVADSVVKQNKASAETGVAIGAGIFNQASLSLNGTTASGNVVDDKHGEAEGGGLYVDEASTKTALDGSTITGNSAVGAKARGGGIFVAGGAPVTLANTVIAGNRPDDCYPSGSVSGCPTVLRGTTDSS